MEVPKLLSKWWFVALVSLAIGIPSAFLAFKFVFGDFVSLDGAITPSIRLMMISQYVFLGGYIILFICSLLTMAPRHVVGTGFPGPDTLMREGHKVIVRKGSYDIWVAKYSLIRVYEEDGMFRCLPTSTGLWAIVLLSLGPPFVMFAFFFLVYINDKCWRSVKDLTWEEKKDQVVNEIGIDELLKDSLRSTFALAREAADVRRASFQDHALILVTFSMLAWAVLMVLSAPIVLDRGPPWWFYTGTAAIAATAIAGILILRRRSKRLVAKEEEWAEKLFSTMEGVDAGISPIEVLLDACMEVPRWLSLHRKGIWTREPGKTLLSFILMVAGSNGLMQYGSIWWGFTLFSIVLLALGISLFSWMAIAARTEAHELAREWEDRMKGMDSFLVPERRR